MQTVKLKLIHAFGSSCSKSYRNSVAICDEDKNEPKIVFPSGKTLARKYIDRAQMDFIEFSQTTQDIQCITVLPTKTHCAVVQKPFGSELQIIKIYSMQSRQQPHVIKIFSQSDKAGRIKQIVFSQSQPKFMCAHLAQPHNKLLFIDTSRNKPLAESNFPLKDIQKLTVCPQNSHLICISGGTTLKLYKVQQYAFKPLQDIRKMPKNCIITQHCWFGDKKILAATDKQQILFIEQIKPNVYEVRQQYRNVFNNNNTINEQQQQQQKQKKFTITYICPFTRGFIMGSGNGKFCLWTRKQDYVNLNGEETQKFQLTRKWSTTTQRQCAVRSISINAKQDLLVISMENNDIAILYLQEIIPQITDLIKQDLTTKNNASSIKQKQKEKQINFQYLYKGFHSAAITGMDICQQRPLFATISRQDSTIRVWNYKAFGCKLLRMFYFKIKGDNDEDHPLMTLAFHPCGYNMAVGCVDKLRVFHVMNNELRPFKEVSIRKCHNIKFSHGGHLLAVSHEFNPELQFDHIRVYNALTLQQLFVYKQCQSLVKQIQWKACDEMLCVVYKSGLLIEWRVSQWTVNKKVVRPQLVFGTCVYNHALGSQLVYTSDNVTKVNAIQQFSTLQNSIQNNNKSIQIDMRVTKMLQIQIKKQKSNFLLGLQNGNLVTFSGLQTLSISSHQNHHLSAITQLILSPCGKYVITCGEDGLIFIYSIKIFYTTQSSNTKQPLKQQQLMKQKQQYSYSTVVDDFLADVVLVNKKEVQKYTQKQKQYSKVIGQLSKRLKILSQQSEKRHQKNIAELQNQKNRTIEDIEYRKSKLQQQISLLQAKNTLSLSQLDDKGMLQIQALQSTYEQKLSFQAQKLFQLQQQLIQLKVLHQKHLQSMHNQQESTIKRLKQQFQSKFKQSQGVFTQTKKQNTQATDVFDLRLQQIQEQQQQQVRELQNKRVKFKQQTASSLQQYHQKLQKLKKQYSILQKQRQQVKSQNDELQFQRKKVQKQVNQTKQKLKDLQVDFDQKLQSLKAKQQKIIQFQQKITQLQKKKHILAYKATQMKRAIQPKQYQIDRLKNDLIKLKKQFQISVQRKQQANLYLQKINKQKQYLAKTLQQQKKRTVQQGNTLQQVVIDIYQCMLRNGSSMLLGSNSNNGQSSTSSNTNANNAGSQPDHKAYFKQLIRLYHKYVNTVNNTTTGGSSNSTTTFLSNNNTTTKSLPQQKQQKDKNTDQVNKQIVHLQKSLFQLNKANQKNILRKNEQIFKRTKQNTQLINNLNELKKQNKQYILKIKSKNIEIDTLKINKQQLLNNCPKTSNIAMFKLMNANLNNNNNEDGYGMQTYASLKKVVGNPSAVSNLSLGNNNINSNNAIGSSLLPGMIPTNTKLKTPIRSNNLPLVFSKQQGQTTPQNINKQFIKSPSIMTQQKSPPQLINVKKRQCEIVSQIEFFNEKIYKFEFFINDMLMKVKKHSLNMNCKQSNDLVEEFQSL